MKSQQISEKKTFSTWSTIEKTVSCPKLPKNDQNPFKNGLNSLKNYFFDLKVWQKNTYADRQRIGAFETSGHRDRRWKSLFCTMKFKILTFLAKFWTKITILSQFSSFIKVPEDIRTFRYRDGQKTPIFEFFDSFWANFVSFLSKICNFHYKWNFIVKSPIFHWEICIFRWILLFFLNFKKRFLTLFLESY